MKTPKCQTTPCEIHLVIPSENQWVMCYEESPFRVVYAFMRGADQRAFFKFMKKIFIQVNPTTEKQQN